VNDAGASNRTCGDGYLAAVGFLASTQRADFSPVCLKMPSIGEPDGERDYDGNPGCRAEGADVGDAPCNDEDDGANEAECKGTK
jgi:hypothetical protein